ncbi:MAG TPA: hypothetical protein VK149_11400 [Sideroxyarcus sp.]|nr:hypothetical protein [Sideroxyarcus sp.]
MNVAILLALLLSACASSSPAVNAAVSVPKNPSGEVKPQPAAQQKPVPEMPLPRKSEHNVEED